MRPRRQGRTTASITMVKIQYSRVGWRYDGPTYGFTTSPEVSPGATVGTVHTGVPPHTGFKSRQGAGRAAT
jgi:hypothetical protein